MCQGKMPLSVRKRYESMMSENSSSLKVENLIKNFDKALSHPDKNDLKKLEKIIKEYSYLETTFWLKKHRENTYQ